MAVAQDVQNGDEVAAFKTLNDAATYLQSQLPSYTPDASLLLGLAKLAGIGGACTPAYGAAGTALGAIAQAYSGGGGLGPTLKAARASLLSTALLMPLAACYVAVSGGLHDNDVNYAVNVLGNSAINATNHYMQSYINGGLGVPPGAGGLAVAGSVSPDYAVGTGIATMTTADLGSAANIKLEAAGMAASLEAYQAQGHHANFLTGVFT